MTDLEWHETPEGYVSDGYRIARLEENGRPRWRLEVFNRVAPWPGKRPSSTSFHTTLHLAMDLAGRLEREWIRRARAKGHIVIGITATVISAFLVAAMQSVAQFVAASITGYIALRGFVDAVTVWLAEVWGWNRDRGGPERMTWTGRLVLAGVQALRRRAAASRDSQRAPSVVVLPPS